MADSTAEARQELERARRRADAELDELGAATRSALDIPAKIRRNPLKMAGLAGGAAFLALGGPKRVIRATEKRVFPGRKEKLESILPKEVARTVDKLGGDAAAVRANLERDFMHYLERKHPEEAPNARRSFWRTYDILAGSLGTLAARTMAKRLFEEPADPRREK